jgi:hypothetical protein
MKHVHTLALLCATIAMAGTALAQERAPAKQAPAKAAGATPVQPARPAAVPSMPVADSEQLLAASHAYYGPYDCEFKQTLSVAKHQVEGYVVVTFSTKAYTMKPVRSSTGALRLEEVNNGPMLLVQIPAKSMLMDTVRGRRIVDACVHEIQAKEASTEPNALGMNLPGQVATGNCAPGTARC